MENIQADIEKFGELSTNALAENTDDVAIVVNRTSTLDAALLERLKAISPEAASEYAESQKTGFSISLQAKGMLVKTLQGARDKYLREHINEVSRVTVKGGKIITE